MLELVHCTPPWVSMPLLNDWKLEITTDDVLRGQGVDPQIIRLRRPRLVDAAALALEVGLPLVTPQVAYTTFPVSAVRHERLVLEGGAVLSGSLVASQLAAADTVTAVVCTIGPALENLSLRVAASDPLHSLALYGVGSAAAEALSNAVCCYFGEQAELLGLHTTIPLNPGMQGWPVEQGQPEIFALVDAAAAGVTLLSSYMMFPQKSLSFVVGMGSRVNSTGRLCDFCAQRENCRYKEHYTVISQSRDSSDE